MSWDLVSYLEEKVSHLSESGSDELTGECPVCGKEVDHFYVHVGQDFRWGKWNCFKCENSGDVWALVAVLEGVSKAVARRMLAREIMAASRMTRRPRLQPTQEEEIDILLPEGFILITAKRPKYLAQRGVSLQLARRYGLGYCQSGEFAGRLIFPVVCPLGRSFTSRAMWKTTKRKYLGGPRMGQLIFGWPQALDQSPGLLVVSEGPMDVLALARAGFSSVAFLGHSSRGSATEKKIQLIRKTKAKVVVCYDPDSIMEGASLAEKLEAKVAVLSTGDPGEVCPDELIRAVTEPVIPTNAKLIYRKRQALSLANSQ